MAKDNTVQYHERTLQLFTSMERPGYTGARVEVQEHLNGSLPVRHLAQILTPQEAPALATRTSGSGDGRSGDDGSFRPRSDGLGGPSHVSRPRCLQGTWQARLSSMRTPQGSRSTGTFVVAGIDRARQQGKGMGRLRVDERPEFEQRFAAVVQRIGSGGLSRNQAASKLSIGYATLKRLLEA